jgi:peptide/nickel transport system substrate-binding protein
VLHLAPGVEFYDGVPLTSEDARFTFEELLLKFHSRARTSSRRQSAAHRDARTVVFKFDRPDAAFLQLIDVMNAPDTQGRWRDLANSF